MDYQIANGIDGLQLAEPLYQAGYKNLYLLSGRQPEELNLPPYITFINKADMMEKAPHELFWADEG